MCDKRWKTYKVSYNLSSLESVFGNFGYGILSFILKRCE
jgi:hypothetical protein